MIRSFVALLIPGAWAEYLGGVERDLAGATSGISWVKPENLHVTLRFLGDLGESGAARAGASVRRGAEESPAIPGKLGGLGAFPTMNRPRVLWAALAEGAPEAVALAKAVNGCLQRDGFGPPDKPFRAHITLGRIREAARGLDALRAYVPPPAPAGAWLDRVALMKSDLHPAGARYTALVEVRLRQPGS
ncbi:MAG: RNA 2',3'-cyclic phosphodiesterase [Candidatus Latescibacteria bacterium]|nr:RNA 2',3'-cyclic phosphodiesterase [Candidatus Latescibacterota bacterium]